MQDSGFTIKVLTRSVPWLAGRWQSPHSLKIERHLLLPGAPELAAIQPILVFSGL